MGVIQGDTRSLDYGSNRVKCQGQNTGLASIKYVGHPGSARDLVSQVQ